MFASGSIVFTLDFTIFSNEVDRIFGNAMILAEAAFFILLIVIDYTLVSFIGWLRNCCKDELECPVEWAAIENHSFNDRIQKTNILGSYKLTNHPKYGHAMKAYNELRFRKKDMEETKDPMNPEFFD